MAKRCRPSVDNKETTTKKKHHNDNNNNNNKNIKNEQPHRTPKKETQNPSNKKEKDDVELTNWKNAIKWIQQNGGFIHDGLTLSTTTTTNNNNNNTSSSDAQRGEVYTTTTIHPNTILLCIPYKCLLTLQTVERHGGTIGTLLFRVVSGIPEALLRFEKNDLVLALFMAFLSSSSKKEEEESEEEFIKCQLFYQPYLSTLPCNSCYDNLPRRWDAQMIKDLLKGTALLDRAQEDQCGVKRDYDLIQEKWEKEKEKEKNKVMIPSLPSFDKFDEMLAAVSTRAFANIEDIDDDDDDNNATTTTNTNNTSSSSSSLQLSLDAMVPIADLLNHKRDKNLDVSYNFCKTKKCIEFQSKRLLKCGTALRMTYGAKSNSVLLNRYGFCLKDNLEPDGSSNDVVEFIVPKKTSSSSSTQSNPMLVLSSSSKNVMKIELQTGPKSYTFGPFVKALEYFYNDDNDCKDCHGWGGGGGNKKDVVQKTKDEKEVASNMEHNHNNDNKKEENEELNHDDSRGIDDDMEDFLNQCEEEEEEEMQNESEDENDNEMDCLACNIDSTSAPVGGVCSSSSSWLESERSIQAECNALTRLLGALKDAENSYSFRGDKLKAALMERHENDNDNDVKEVKQEKKRNQSLPQSSKSSSSSPSQCCSFEEHYAAILVDSELRTLHFFQLATQLIFMVLRNSICCNNDQDKNNLDDGGCGGDDDDDDGQRKSDTTTNMTLSFSAKMETTTTTTLTNGMEELFQGKTDDLIVKQAKELMTVFLKIRYPTLCPQL